MSDKANADQDFNSMTFSTVPIPDDGDGNIAWSVEKVSEWATKAIGLMDGVNLADGDMPSLISNAAEALGGIVDIRHKYALAEIDAVRAQADKKRYDEEVYADRLRLWQRMMDLDDQSARITDLMAGEALEKRRMIGDDLAEMIRSLSPKLPDHMVKPLIDHLGELYWYNNALIGTEIQKRATAGQPDAYSQQQWQTDAFSHPLGAVAAEGTEIRQPIDLSQM